MAKSTKPKEATSHKETAFGILPRSKIISLEARGVKKALQHIIKLGEENTKITPQLIYEIHKVAFGSIFPDWAGKFRTINVKVGDYEPPHYSKVPELVKMFCDDLEERLKYLPDRKEEERFLAEVVGLLAWFQHRFVWIHPFKDYNGRMGRLLTNLLALNTRLPVLEIKADTGKDREHYVNAMKAADSHDLTKLEKLVSEALKENLEKI
ncbi:MAG: Fic family protein [Candidatus Blackburnbacteria bacterium]|nr:Fic family protein [Candidatus Blackburnbacteria bacterium]